MFPLRPRGGSAISAKLGDPVHAKNLAALFTNAGLPTQVAPATIFGPLFHSMLAVETARLLAFRAAGWDLETLAARPDLLRQCAWAMREAAQIARKDGGVFAWFTSLLPMFVFHRMVRHRAQGASLDFCDVWRYHGPKTSEQIDFFVQQLLDRAGNRPTAALRQLQAPKP